ncbi:MerR family transcriptional regulator [Tautonia plasticadhaerens]|uniref:Mercuric resistance operon regulatory protein n=1 Tax=Tautonia plasticadhaerens TaxID=2527974 RepID=A0A518H1A1_9BACT|nr:MerR family DNA-binding protein [Tautonia plasticadhaerens]QDV34598.1 Mercuric resistance operon regulatory protein [Tautonia plasticadhaerens]
MEKPLTIGNVARRAGVGVETVRFYERQGLLHEPERRASGYRQYDEGVVDRLRFIRRAKELGFTLKEIAELLDLRHDPAATRSDVRERVRGKVEDIEAKVRDLLRIKDVLLALERTCHGHGPAEDCPILATIDRPDEATTTTGDPQGAAGGRGKRHAKSPS